LATAGEPASGLDFEPAKLIGRRAVCHRLTFAGNESSGLRATRVWNRHAGATEMPTIWTQDGTEMLLGRLCRQGGAGSQCFRLIHMGDWCDSRNHTMKQRARIQILKNRKRWIEKAIAEYCE